MSKDMQINNRGAKIQEKENSSTCIKRREAAFLKLLAYMDSELLLQKSFTKLVDNNKIYTLKFSQKTGLSEPIPDQYNIVSKVKEQ